MKMYIFLFVGALMYLNEATLLNNIRIRYMKDCIYVSTFVFFSSFTPPYKVCAKLNGPKTGQPVNQ